MTRPIKAPPLFVGLLLAASGQLATWLEAHQLPN